MSDKLKLLALLLFSCAYVDAQPVESSKQRFDAIQVYRDLKDDKLFYYAPGDLKLGMDRDGKPRFQLLQMRYTGSSAYGDNGEKRFLNIVQFSVTMEQAGADALKEVKKQLGSPPVDLRPLPVRTVDAFLVAPIGEGNERGNYKKIGKDGSFQAEGISGVSDKSGFWTERTFTLKLENHEAQLLWEQVAAGQLALSFAYSVYADMFSAGKGDMAVKQNGDRALDFESSNKDILTADTTLVTQLVKADAFPINVDVRKWPELLKKIDINEGLPPAYAALEVRCFDFANDLRPDLSVKGIDIAATGVGGSEVTIPTQKFLRSEPDLFAKQIRFPYAVRLTQPYRYRIVEYTVDGEKIVSEWKTAHSWTSHLDITTPQTNSAFEKREVDIELRNSIFSDSIMAKVDIVLVYTFRGKEQRVLVEYDDHEDIPIKQVILRCDKDSRVLYEVNWTLADGSQRSTSGNYVPEDNYLYLIIPD